MPQIRLEYSANCRPDRGFNNLFSSIHRIVHEVGGINLENCKSRAIRLDDFYIADGDPCHAFAHLSVRFIEGRSDRVKSDIGRECLQAMQNFFAATLESHTLQLTVEVQDIGLKDYHKYPAGTLTMQDTSNPDQG